VAAGECRTAAPSIQTPGLKRATVRSAGCERLRMVGYLMDGLMMSIRCAFFGLCLSERNTLPRQRSSERASRLGRLRWGGRPQGRKKNRVAKK
jgi:hypothetical protein